MKLLIKKITLIFILLLICMVSIKPLLASDPFVSIKLESGLSFDLPQNWIVLDQNTKTTLEASTVSRIPFAISSNLPFAANLYDWNKQTIAMVNVRIYPDSEVIQEQVRELNDAELAQLSSQLEVRMIQSIAKIGAEITDWFGTSKHNIQNKTYLRTEYRRTSAFKSDTIFRVTLLRFLSGEKSFTVTLSYDEKQEVLLKPIINRIEKSLQID